MHIRDTQKNTTNLRGKMGGAVTLVATCSLMIALMGPATTHAQNYEGKWNRTSLQFSVTVQSWGKNCGVMPRSYSSRRVKPTEILQNNGHLFFASGALRTDRCNSPNPLLVTLATSRSANMWTRTCETPKSASKYERVDYTFDGNGDTLTYKAESSFDWTLKSDRCLVSWVESRVYQRATSGSPDSRESPILKVHDGKSFPPKSGAPPQNETVCNPSGKIRKLIIAPQNATISPSEKLCFQVRGVDKEGCRFSVSPTWTVTQNGVSHGDLISPRGCFIAGDNAAESEGIYQIDAKYKGQTASTSIEIAYPNIEDLAQARLNLAEELGEDPPQEIPDNKSIPQKDIVQLPTQMPPASETSKRIDPWLIVLLVVAVVVFVVLMISIVWLLRKQSGDDTGRTPSMIPNAEQSLLPTTSRIRLQNAKICPTCGAKFSADAQYCPADASVLKKNTRPSVRSSMPPPKGMICPVCKRGYSLESRFCPHDSTALVDYEKWRRK